MERVVGWLGREKLLNIDRLSIIFECARYFCLYMEDAVTYKNHLNDIVISAEKGFLYLIDEEIFLYPFEENLVHICVPEHFDGYEISGRNFVMEVYE